MKNSLSVLLVVAMYSSVFAQSDSGILFNTDLSWSAIVQKAKQDDKLIFVDCYTTWCGPCKKMDKEVFAQKEVGDYFNRNFICAKLQMDQTVKDDQVTKNNYDIARKFEKQYRITSYPCFLFLRADGKLIHRVTGYTIEEKFITMAKEVSRPGYTYNDPYKKYDSLISLYRKGKHMYSEMPYLIETTKKLANRTLKDSLSKDFYSYLKGLNKKDLLTKTNIEFLSGNVTKIQDPFVKVFYKYGSEINSIMKDSIYSRTTLDIIIAKHIIDSTLLRFYKTVSFDSAKNKGIEPSWDAIYKTVISSFGPSYAKRAVRAAKVKFFRSINEYRKVAKVVDIQIREKDLNLSDIQVMAWINDDAWRIFLYDQDKETFELALSWMRVIVEEAPNPLPSWIDTYANLLYKASHLGYINQLTEAILTEKKAIDSAQNLSVISKNDYWKSQVGVYIETQNKMQRGLTTWDN